MAIRWACLLLTLMAPQPEAPQQDKLLRRFRKEFVAIRPGTEGFPRRFRMGGDHVSAQPRRDVTLNAAFEICRYETTQELYTALMGANPSRWKGPRNSVEMVSFSEAETFCQRATAKLRALKLITEKQVVRLPSEAEWEYATRAGSSARYCFGDDVEELDAYAWHTGNAAGNDPPVGAKKPNRWGLYDVHGYLWEWCADHGHASYQGAPQDARPWTTGGDEKQRVLRGGSWKDSPEALASWARHGGFRSASGRVAFSGGVTMQLRDDAVGFRCVISPASER